MPQPMPTALGVLADQPRVQAFLASALANGVAHAYLFTGAPGSGMQEAATALAQGIVCPNGGCGTCDECRRVARRTHADVHFLEPTGVSGYRVEQVRDLIDDTLRAPIRAASKVYVLDRADTLRDSSANALLKTIEEPPAGVVFILIAPSTDAVLPTIVSRCQVVPFRALPPEVSERAVIQATGAESWQARLALAIARTPREAIGFLNSASRRDVRRKTVSILTGIFDYDSWDVLLAAKDLAEAARIPLEDVREAQKAEAERAGEFLSASALRSMEDANKRALTARERAGMAEILAAGEAVLRDALICCDGIDERVVNEDMSDAVVRLAARTCTENVLIALGACNDAARKLDANVSPQLVLEDWLLSIKEALACPR